MMSLDAVITGSFATYRQECKTKLWGGGGKSLTGNAGAANVSNAVTKLIQ